MTSFLNLYLPDIILALAVLFFALLGWKKGLILTLSGLLTVLMAIFGAKYLAEVGSGILGPLFVPLLKPFVTDRLTVILTQASGETLQLGIFALIPAAKTLVENATLALIDTVVPAVTLELAKAVAWVVLFVVGFVVLFVALNLVVRILNGIASLPGLHLINALGGGLLGALKGFLLVWLVATLLVHFGVLSDTWVTNGSLLASLIG